MERDVESEPNHRRCAIGCIGDFADRHLGRRKFHRYRHHFDSTMVQHFDGATWKIVPSPSPLPKSFLNQNIFTSVQAVSPTDVTAVGFLNDANNQRVLTLIEHWNGTK